MPLCALTVRRPWKGDKLALSSNTVLFYTVALITAVVDQLTKAAARVYLSEDLFVRVIPGFFDLRLSFNRGAAFGLMPDWAPLFIVVTLVAIFAIVRLRSKGPKNRTLTLGLALLMGGALGNLVDRLFSPDRGVTDFLSFYVNVAGQVRAWPTFNIADAAVVVGAFMMFAYVYLLENRRIDVA